MAEDVVDLGRIQAGVERAEDAASEGHCVRRFENARDVGREHGNALAVLNPARLQGGREPLHAVEKFGVGATNVAIDDGDFVTIDGSAALEKVERIELTDIQCGLDGSQHGNKKLLVLNSFALWTKLSVPGHDG